jgi:hypothetical protein
VIGHGGDTQWFHSDLHLFIDNGDGTISVSSDNGPSGKFVCAIELSAR